jgi:hypothetical protein
VIGVLGYLDDAWADQLGLSPSHALSLDGIPLTVLAGRLSDQAALFGVLNGLYSLGFALLSVESVPVASSQRSSATIADQTPSQPHEEKKR